MTNKTKRPRGANPRAKTGKTGDLLFTPILPHDGEKDNTQNSFYNDLLARLADLERKGAIIDARLATGGTTSTANVERCSTDGDGSSKIGLNGVVR